MGELREELRMTLEIMRDTSRRNEETVQMLIRENQELRKELRELRDKIDNNKTDKLQSEVMRTFKKKKKDLVKRKIFDIINTTPCSLAQLKELIVDEHQYCSKATFYRYFDEIQKEGTIEQADDRIYATIER